MFVSISAPEKLFPQFPGGTRLACFFNVGEADPAGQTVTVASLTNGWDEIELKSLSPAQRQLIYDECIAHYDRAWHRPAIVSATRS